MAKSFKSLLNATNTLDKYDAAVKKLQSKGGFEQDNKDEYWQPTADKAGNGYAIIRFLPPSSHENDDIPFVRFYHHGFRGPGGWYIEKSLTTFNKSDPVAEANSKLWEMGPAGQKIVRGDGSKENPGRKRKLTYVSNILVIEDPANPENNGKVFKYKYGESIFEKINDAMNPKTPVDPKFDPFDFMKGADFILKIRKKDGYRNYGDSKFKDCAPLSEDEKFLEKVWRQEYSLAAEIAEDKFKSYDELSARLAKVLGSNADKAPTKTAEASIPSEEAPWEPDPTPAGDNDEDDDMAFFKRVAG